MEENNRLSEGKPLRKLEKEIERTSTMYSMMNGDWVALKKKETASTDWHHKVKEFYPQKQPSGKQSRITS
jgi:hypothetical protein